MANATKPFDPMNIVPLGDPKPLAARPQASITKRDKRSAGRGKLNGTLTSICQMLRGGQTTLLHLVRITAATELKAAELIAAYDALTSTAKAHVNLEDLCTQCEIQWPKLVGWAFEAAATTGQHLAAMKAALALPEVVDRSIKEALTKKGYRDREFLYSHSRFIPVPGGSTISVVNQVAANARASNDTKAFVPFESDVMDEAPSAGKVLNVEGGDVSELSSPEPE